MNATSRLEIASLAFLAYLFPVPIAGAQEQLCRFPYAEAPGTEITVENAFSHAPSWGFLPARVTIKNGSAKARTWRIHFTARGGHFNSQISLSSEFRLDAGPQSEATHEILVPLATSLDPNTYGHQIEITAGASGLRGRSQTHYSQFSKNWPSIGISDELAANNLKKLDDKVKAVITPAHANQHFGLSFQAAHLPEDWRGLVGLDALMLTDKEWRKLPPARRQAVLQWQRMGGRLRIYTESEALKLDELGFATAPSDSAADSVSATAAPRSLGRVELARWDGRELDIEHTFKSLRSTPLKAQSLEQHYASNWQLQKQFGTKDFKRGLILAVLAVFGILVGPVNLWFLAKPGRRHRLFVTTPLLSIGASVAMALMILFSDGIGGRGLRFAAINLEPGASERKAYIFQEQIARNGLLLDRSFALQDAGVVSDVNLPESPWSQFGAGSGRSNSLRIRGNRFEGDWFRSRSEVGHALQAVRTTRARVERIRDPGGATPRLFSSLGFGLDQLYYVDVGGTVWKSTAPAASGHEIALVEAPEAEFAAWWKEQNAPASAFLREKLAGLADRRDHFFATTADPGAGPLDTGTFIRWQTVPVVVFGGLVEVESPRPPEA